MKTLFLPYIKYRRYLRNKGVRGYFYPIVDFIVINRNDVREKNDGFASYKELAREDPNVKADVVNLGGGQIMLQLLGAQASKEFFQHPEYYEKNLFAPAFTTLLSTGLSTAEGKLWKQHRRIISNTFHFDFVKGKIPMMANTAKEFLNKLEKGGQKEVKIMDELQKITGEIVGRTFFSENLNDYKIEGQPLTLYLANLLIETFTIMGDTLVQGAHFMGVSPSISPAFRKVMQKVKEFRNLAFKIIQDRKASNIQVNDMLGLLIETQKKLNKEEAFSDEDIVNEFITFFVAGMDTTGHSISMALYELNKHPEYYAKVRKEVDEIYNREEPVTPNIIHEMQFTHVFLKEVLRLYPPSAGLIPRIALVDHTLDGIEIKKGALIKPSFMYIHFNPKYYSEPLRFYPERWLDKSVLQEPFSYLPFAAGPRNCIGQHFAMIESKIILAEFLKKFNFELSEDYKLRMTIGFLHEPLDPLVMKLTPKF